MKTLKKVLFIAFLIFPFILLLFACDSPPQQKTEKKQNAITKKIVLPAKAVKPEPAKAVKPENKDLQKDDNLKDDLQKDKTDTNYYVSAGKIDPFISPIIKENNKETKKIINRKLTPLEKLDLSQLKLVAIINMSSGKKNIAMVQESSGKGYMVKVGTYIGTNYGKIIEIKNDEIIIKERIKNFKGVYEDLIKKMKLQKKDNG
ncbi:MAG: pilus assembly protein PilP [Desulfobacteraceae bacterium]|nr:pilus assembly protein PilP [Desulfobacteraceae bacterium]